ncbi:hypothetical protein ACFL45_02860 [Candidatus Neomarinimicrobiota bacterium]
MKTPKADYQPYIVRPLAGLAEGEIDLDAAGGNANEALMPFIMQLLQAAMQDEAEGNRDAAAISSLSVQRQAGQLAGRIYGQAYTEKRGETVVFLRAKLFDAEGRLTMTCMATSHVSQSG